MNLNLYYNPTREGVPRFTQDINYIVPVRSGKLRLIHMVTKLGDVQNVGNMARTACGGQYPANKVMVLSQYEDSWILTYGLDTKLCERCYLPRRVKPTVWPLADS